MIHWWRTTFGEEEIDRISQSIRNQCISQGKVTAEFERKLSEYLQVEHVVATSSGSTALMLALMAAGVRPGDEVIVPNRTWIATAHAAYLLGAKVVLVDVEPNRPSIDVSKIEEKITQKTKAIMPVHMNGRAVTMRAVNSIAKKHKLAVIEDAAQAIGSRNVDGFLGTQSDIGCFSLSVAKTIATGQGGFAVTKNSDLAFKLRALRTHGVENVTDPKQWGLPGFNFRFTDVQASIGLEQLKRLPSRIERLKEIYSMYQQGVKQDVVKSIPVDVGAGEVPVYNEYLVPNRDEFVAHLQRAGIETRPFYPDLDRAPYLDQGGSLFPNSRKYGESGIYFPSGPSQTLDDLKAVIRTVNEMYR